MILEKDRNQAKGTGGKRRLRLGQSQKETAMGMKGRHGEELQVLGVCVFIHSLTHAVKKHFFSTCYVLRPRNVSTTMGLFLMFAVHKPCPQLSAHSRCTKASHPVCYRHLWSWLMVFRNITKPGHFQEKKENFPPGSWELGKDPGERGEFSLSSAV